MLTLPAGSHTHTHIPVCTQAQGGLSGDGVREGSEGQASARMWQGELGEVDQSNQETADHGAKSAKWG